MQNNPVKTLSFFALKHLPDSYSERREILKSITAALPPDDDTRLGALSILEAMNYADKCQALLTLKP